MDLRRNKGQKAEDFAANYLIDKLNYRILTRNFRKAYGEIDLVAFNEESDTIIFIEVKSGNQGSFPYYQESINKRKREKISKVATEYIENSEVEYSNIRFDALFIERGVSDSVKAHIKNIIMIY